MTAAAHEIIHGLVNDKRFDVRGFTEHGTTTTPFNDRGVRSQFAMANGCSHEHFEAPEIRDSIWSAG